MKDVVRGEPALLGRPGSLVEIDRGGPFEFPGPHARPGGIFRALGPHSDEPAFSAKIPQAEPALAHLGVVDFNDAGFEQSRTPSSVWYPIGRKDSRKQPQPA